MRHSSSFISVERIDSEVSSVLAMWPDDKAFRALEVIEANPHLAKHPRARIAFAIQEFADCMQGSDVPEIPEFAARFGDVRKELESRLHHLLSCEMAHSLLRDDINWPRPGQRVNNFLLVEQLGIGAFSRVFKALDVLMGNREVVVKLTSRPAAESQLAGPLDHPHLAQMLSVSVDKKSGLTVLCMPYRGRLTCADLRSISPFNSLHSVDDATPPTWEYIQTVVEITATVADGVQHLHDHGVIHRDIKPPNIVLSQKFDATLVDFNAATPFADASGLVVGTLPYVAPEILDGIRAGGMTGLTISPRVDVYSLGLVCYELLAGELPFEVPEIGTKTIAPYDVLRRAQFKNWVPLRDRNSTVSRSLAEIVSRAIDPDASRRFSTAAQFCRALRKEMRPLARLKRRIRCARTRHQVAGAAAASLLLIATGYGTTTTLDIGTSEVDTPVSHSPADRQTTEREEAERAVYQMIQASDLFAAEDAYRMLDKRVDLSSAARTNWGFLLFHQRRLHEADSQLRQALETGPLHALTLRHLSTIELVQTATSSRMIPDDQFVRRMFNEFTVQDPQAHLDAAMILCIRAERDNTLSAAGKDQLLSEAAGFFRQAIELGMQEHILLPRKAQLLPIWPKEPIAFNAAANVERFSPFVEPSVR